MRSSAGPWRAQTDVRPASWEVPTAVAAMLAAGGLMLLPAAQAVAATVAGHGWVWPHGRHALGLSLRGFLTGHIGQGLSADQVHRLPPAFVVWALIAVSEAMLAALCIWALAAWWRYSGPGARQGMASGSQIEVVLGRARLRRSSGLIRPDVYRRGAARRPRR